MSTKIHIGSIILQKLKEKERSIAWLARKIGCNDANLGRLLKNSQYLHSELLKRIAKALKENLFAYYTEEFEKEEKEE